MGDFSQTHPESLQRWETNAEFWDQYIGDTSNAFHNLLVRPDTEALLDIQPGDLVLDIACGNGNFSRRLADLGAEVIAFDYSPAMIERARMRSAAYEGQISYQVCDATDEAALLSLRASRPFDKAVANMAIMDISDIAPLAKALHLILEPGGTFVFSTHHPCFVKPDERYMTAQVHEGEAITGIPVNHLYYHRPLAEIFRVFFAAGFTMDRFSEKADNQPECPVIFIARFVNR